MEALDLLGAVRSAMARKEALLAELAKIDGDLAEIRKLLGVPVPNDVKASAVPVEPATPAPPAPDVPMRPCPVCDKPFIRTSPRQRMCPTCTATSPHRSVEHLAHRRGVATDRLEEHQRICERCGERCIPAPGSAGRFCSRKCYLRTVSAPRQACVQPRPSPPEQKPSEPVAAAPVTDSGQLSVDAEHDRPADMTIPSVEPKTSAPLRQPLERPSSVRLKPDREPSWWVGKSRDELQTEVTSRQEQMGQSRMARFVDGNVRE